MELETVNGMKTFHNAVAEKQESEMRKSARR
jgi:hypothetical protein